MKEERKVVELNIDDILPNRFQPRIKFNEEAIIELSESIKEYGVIQPIVVRKIDDKYEIIAGERRYKASLLAGKTTIPALITDFNDKDSAEVALIENVQRKDLTPIEEAVSYKKILDMGYLTQETLATKLGKTQSTVANKLRLLNLDEDVQEALLEGKISERHARSLLRLPGEKQSEVALKIIESRMTVRKTDDYINEVLEQLKKEKQTAKESLSSVKIPLQAHGSIEPLIKERVEPYMDQSQPVNQNSNMPVEPIVEEVEEIIPQINLSENPGFMDVDHIKEIASDINVSKPVANVDQLLQKDPMIPSQPIPTMEEEDDSAESLLRPGKFFSFNDIDEPETSPVTPSGNSPLFTVPPLDPVEIVPPATSTFGAEPNKTREDTFDFDQFFGTRDVKKEEPAIVSELVEASPDIPVSPLSNLVPPIDMEGTPNVEDILDEPEILDLPEEYLNQNVVTEEVDIPVQEPVIAVKNNDSKQDILTPTEEPGSSQFFNFDFMNQAPVEESVQPTIDNQSIPTTPNPVEEMPTSIGFEPFSVSEPFLSSPPSPAPEVEEEDTTSGGFIELNPFTPMSEENIPVEEVMVSPVKSEPSSIYSNIITPSVTTSMPQVDKVTEEPIINQTVENNVYLSGDLKMVINTIRECAATIEKYGFMVDTEELDFEDTYEVTFKIEKK